MKEPALDTAAKLARLRHDFDQVFASPHREDREEVENILAIRLSGDLYGLSVREIAAVVKAGPLVPLPSRSPGLMGIAGYRGTILPVYRLGTLLGYEASREAPRWLAVCGERDALALAFEEIEGYVPVSRTSFFLPDGNPKKHVERFARIGETVRAIVSIAAVLETIQGRN